MDFQSLAQGRSESLPRELLSGDPQSTLNNKDTVYQSEIASPSRH